MRYKIIEIFILIVIEILEITKEIYIYKLSIEQSWKDSKIQFEFEYPKFSDYRFIFFVLDFSILNNLNRCS